MKIHTDRMKAKAKKEEEEKAEKEARRRAIIKEHQEKVAEEKMRSVRHTCMVNRPLCNELVSTLHL